MVLNPPPPRPSMEISNDQMTLWNPTPSLEKKLRPSTIQAHPQPQQLAFGHQPALGGAVQLQFGGTVGAVAVGGVSVGAGQPAVAQALQMTAGSGSTLESHPALTTLSPEQKLMVVRLSQVTTMNLKYSVKCLQDNAFDYDKALEGFKLIGVSAIPLEAFVRDY